MTGLLDAILAYSVQVTAVVAISGVATLVVQLASPQARLIYWRAVACLCLALPALSVRPGGLAAASVTFDPVATSILPSIAVLPVLPAVQRGCLWLLAAGIAVRLMWLLLGARHLRELRRQSVPAEVSDAIMVLRDQVAPHAEFRSTSRIEQPVAFGRARPVVMLPRSFHMLGSEAQQAVACHELAHVARGDWTWIVVEEHLRALFWFHPAVWWLLDQVQLSREQVVNRFVVTHTGIRKPYMEALLALADVVSPRTLAMAFLRRRHLASRIGQLSKEAHMSRLRLTCSVCALVILVGGATRAVVAAWPLNLVEIGGVDAAGTTSLEIRLAELQPGAGLIPAAVPASDHRVYLHPDVIANATDVIHTRVYDSGNGQYTIATEFGDAAAGRLTTLTSTHIGRPVVILLDGQVIAAPTVRSAVGRHAVFTGAFTKSQAERIARSLSPVAAQDASPAAADSQQRPFKSGDAGLVMPVALKKVQPRYPKAAQDAKVTGSVKLSAIVRPDGTTDRVVVIRSVDTEYGVDQSAIDAVKQWRFTPGTMSGQAVPVQMEFTIRFSLS